MLLGLYLGATFVTNHVGMPIPARGDELGFLRRQVLTSRNLSSPSLIGFFFGGLDSQIEHHLFPTMPGANLRRARELVRPFCAGHHIDYVEQRPHRAYGDVFRHLRLGRCPRAPFRPSIGSESTSPSIESPTERTRHSCPLPNHHCVEDAPPPERVSGRRVIDGGV